MQKLVAMSNEYRNLAEDVSVDVEFIEDRYTGTLTLLEKIYSTAVGAGV